MSDTGAKMGAGCVLAVVVALILVGLFYLAGPAGMYNEWSAWSASAYGSDWLVVQYAQDGTVIHHWELEDSAINNESESDGIYFTTPEGVVHLSGHYIYVQKPQPELKRKLLKIGSHAEANP